MSQADKQKHHYDQYFAAQSGKQSGKLSFKEHFLDSSVNHSRLSEHDRVLELGCGSGIFTRRLLAKGATVTGLDISSAGLAVMKAELRGAVEAGQLKLVEADLDRYLASATDQYDVICGSGIIHHLSNPNGTIGLMKRCLAPGGRIFFGPEPNATGLYGLVWRFLAPSVYRFLKADFIWDVEKGTLNITVRNLHRMFSHHGFTDIDIRPFQVLPHFNLDLLRQLDIQLIRHAGLRSVAAYLAVFARLPKA